MNQNFITAFAGLSWKLITFLWQKLMDFVYIVGLGRHEDEPIISSADMLTSTGLQSMATGMMGKYMYNLLTNSTGKVMMVVTLDRNTYMHLVAVGGKSGLDSKFTFSRKWLERVELEGNFPDDFRMYCTRGVQVETRQLFGPETMAQFQDFCRAYNFELFHDSVYISVAQGAHDDDDSTTMVTDITNFITHNQRVFDNI